MRPIKLLEPDTLAEAIDYLQRYETRASILAGGTDLLVKWQKKQLHQVSPEKTPVFINIKKLTDLKTITYYPGEQLEIGSLATHGQIFNNNLVNKRFSLLGEACRQVGSPQIRNMGTLGGNLCNASPAADTAAALLVMDARVRLVGAEGEREMPLTEFFVGPGKTKIKHGEILTAIIIPDLGEGAVGCYLKLGQRSSLEIAIVGVAVKIHFDQYLGREVRIGLGAVAPIPIRAARAEKVWEGKELTEELIQQGAEQAAIESSPISDLRANADYRREMVKLFVARAANKLLAKRRDV